MITQLSREQYEKTNWWKDTQCWIANIQNELDSKKSVPLKRWKVFEAPRWAAARRAARDAVRGAARGAAWDAAWDAARDAARGAARDAAWDAARGAAMDAAMDAAWDAARDAARGAAWDAALLAKIKICAGLNIDKKHIKHAEERWEANKRGYRVLCDVNGVLYVYRKK